MEKTCVEEELPFTVTRVSSEPQRQKICNLLKKYKADSSEMLKTLQDHLDILESDIEKRSREVKMKENQLQALTLTLKKIQKQIKGGEAEAGDKEKELDFLRSQIKSEEEQLQVLSLKSEEIRKQIEQQTNALEEKGRVIKAAEIEAGDKGKELDLLRNQIKSEERTLMELKKSVKKTQSEFESNKKELRPTSSVFVKHGQQPVAAETEQFNGEPFMRCKLSSASLSHHEVSNVLRAKSNPAEYVLDLVEGEVWDAHRKNDLGLRELVVENLVLFIEELAETGGSDKPQLQLKAKLVATLWKTMIRIESPRSCLEALAFLLFIVAYELKSLINVEETALLVTSVSHYKQGPKLFHSLGLELKIPDFVLRLINDHHYIPAVRLVCLFKLKDFSAANLLRKEIIELRRSASEKAEQKDVGKLRAIVELAADYKLEIDFPADLIAKLVFQKENSTPPVLHCSVETPNKTCTSSVNLQVPKREIPS